MPTPTYIPLQTITLGSAASSVTFASIPQTYRDLVLVVNGTASTGLDNRIQFNGDTASNYSEVRMYGVGTAGSDTTAGGNIRIGDLYSTQSNNIVQVMDYSATEKHKTILSRGNSATNSTIAIAGRWASTSTITSINVFVATGNYVSGSTFSLYGIEA